MCLPAELGESHGVLAIEKNVDVSHTLCMQK